MTHRVKIRLYYMSAEVLGPAGPRTEDRTIPWKWTGICTCGWHCVSWFWQHPENPERGALTMSLEHLQQTRRIGMNWLERMNWSFLDDDDAAALWEEAGRRYFEEDEPLETAFTNALRSQGFVVSD